MIGDRPLSFVFKPPKTKARDIEDQRRLLGLKDSYGSDRFHLTFVPLGDEGDSPGALLDLLDLAVQAAALEPFHIELARFSGNAMRVGKGASEMCRIQRQLVGHLTAIGLALPSYRLRPHLSLVYGENVPRVASFPPIAWQASRLLLIRSIHGEGLHEPLAEWQLVSRQGVLPL